MHWPLTSKTEPGMRPPRQSVSPSTKLAFKLFRQLASEQQTRNLFFSPASVMLCLWMLHDGATGETRESMAKVLEVADLDPEAMQLAFVAIKSALQVYGPLQLEAVYSVWCNQELAPRSEYVAKIREDYDADVVALDFRDAATAARINSWVSAKTRGKIGSILCTIDPLTALLAINAIYFKDLWSEPFERELTREELFYMSEGGSLRVPLMRQNGSYLYYEESKFQAISLHYKATRLAMYVFLPAKTSNLREFQQNLTSTAWDAWIGRFEMIEGHIRLPRFKLIHSANLNNALEKLGMGIAFDPRRARFDTINLPPPEIWISQIFHRALVEVNEEGTEAAAETEGTVYFSSEKPSARTFEMIVDRPFFFAICDNYTNTILFMGSVEEPGS